MSLFNVRKKAFGIKIGRDWNKYKNFGRTFILIQFTLPAKDRYNVSHLRRSVLILFIRGKKLVLYRPEKLWVICTPKYLKPDWEI